MGEAVAAQNAGVRVARLPLGEQTRSLLPSLPGEGYLQLLSQLTKVGDYDEATFTGGSVHAGRVMAVARDL